MKKFVKLISVLLICLCLVSFNINNIKAKDNDGATVTCTYGTDYTWSCSPQTTTLNNEDLLKISNQSDMTVVYSCPSNTPGTPTIGSVNIGETKDVYTCDSLHAGSVIKLGSDKDTNVGAVKVGRNMLADGNTVRQQLLSLENPSTSTKISSIVVIKSEASELADAPLDIDGVGLIGASINGDDDVDIKFYEGDTVKTGTNCAGMFSGLTGVKYINLKGVDFSSATDMSSMFAGDEKLTTLCLPDTVNGFNTTNVTNMNSMFDECKSLKLLDLSGNYFVTTSVGTANNMFKDCTSLEKIYINGDASHFASATSTADMFKNCNSIKGGNGTTYNPNKVDKEYARLDKTDQIGYFSNVSSATANFNPVDGYFYANIGGVDTKIEGIKAELIGGTRYTVTMNNLDFTSNNNGLSITLPPGTTKVIVNGNNVINNIYYGNTSTVIGDGTTPWQEVEFSGSGTLTLNNTFGGKCLETENIVINGPTINLSADSHQNEPTYTLAANKFRMKKGAVKTAGNIGMAMQQTASGMPRLEIEEGFVDIVGTYIGFAAMSDQKFPGFSDVAVQGAQDATFESPLSPDCALFDYYDSEISKHQYFYVDSSGVTLRHIRFEKLNNPSPDPEPSPSSKKDESCEKVIGPTWHWNNTKGICEDVGVVGTYTK